MHLFSINMHVNYKLVYYLDIPYTILCYLNTSTVLLIVKIIVDKGTTAYSYV